MSYDDVYLAIVDDVWEEIEKQNPKSREDVMKIAERIVNEIVDKIETAMYDIYDDYCEEKELEWDDEL